MRLLADTHAAIWFITGDSQLSARAYQAIEEAEICYVSIATLWEIGIKTSLGKLDLMIDLPGLIKLLEASGFITLPITKTDILKVAELPFHHRDPFDRIIIAQAILNNFTVVTRDSHFPSYPISFVW